VYNVHNQASDDESYEHSYVEICTYTGRKLNISHSRISLSKVVPYFNPSVCAKCSAC